MKKKSLHLNLRSVNSNCFHVYIKFIERLLVKLNLNFTLFNLPTTKKRITLLKSPFVNKRAREQFEIKFYKAIIRVHKDVNVSTLNFLLMNKPSTVQLKIQN